MKHLRSLPLLCLIALQAPALAQPFSAPFTDGYTAGGFRIAPRHLDRTGDIDLGLYAGTIYFPMLNHSGGISQLTLQGRVSDQAVLFTSIGPQFEFGVRGKLWSSSSSALGWDAAYRIDEFLFLVPYSGSSNPYTNPETIGQGLDLRLNAMQVSRDLNLFLSPVLSILNNRSSLGVETGFEYTQDGVVLGFDLGYRQNLSAKTLPNITLLPFELTYGAGVRYRITENWALQGNYQFIQSNTYYVPYHNLLLGFRYRFNLAE